MKTNKKAAKPVGISGWVCPVCGKGNSPFNTVCPCVSSPIAPIKPWIEPQDPHDPWDNPRKAPWIYPDDVPYDYHKWPRPYEYPKPYWLHEGPTCCEFGGHL